MNHGPREMAQARRDAEINRVHIEANAHLAQIIRRDFPDHQDFCHLMHRGITYEYKAHRTVVNAPNPSNGAVNMSTREIRDDLFERDEGSEDQHYQFHLRDGSLAATIDVFILEPPLGLVDLPPAIRLFRTSYYYRSERPLHATVTVLLQSPMQILGLNNGPIY